MPKIKLSGVAMQVRLAYVEIATAHATLKDAEKFSTVFVCQNIPRTYSPALWLTEPCPQNSRPITG